MDEISFSTSISEAEISKRVKEIGADLNKRFKGSKEEVVAVCVLKGSFIFYADLIRELQADVICDFFSVSSYVDSHSTGEVKVTLDLNSGVRGRHVLLVEDIVDTGLTMNY